MKISRKNSPKYDLIKLFVVYCMCNGIDDIKVIIELALKCQIPHSEIARTYWQHLKGKGLI